MIAEMYETRGSSSCIRVNLRLEVQIIDVRLNYSRVHISLDKAFFKIHSSEINASSYEGPDDFH